MAGAWANNAKKDHPPQAVVRPLSSEYGPGAHNGPRVGPDSRSLVPTYLRALREG